MARPSRIKTGDRFGRLVVGEWNKEKQGYLCTCDCGNVVYQGSGHLLCGSVLSCGCYRKECDVVDGWSQTPTWSSFRSMHQRCDGEDRRGNYLEKRITVCERWELSPEGFFNFLEDMGERPGNLTLERILLDGNYCPENCKWETRGNQAFNRGMFKNNRSGVTGVSFDKSKDKWIARLDKGGKNVFRGAYDFFEDACIARKQAKEYFYKDKLEEIRSKTEV